MTAICNGGPSAALPNVPAVVTVTAVAIESTLILTGNPEVAAILAPFLAATPFIVSDFCTHDPPPDPGLTAQDIADAVEALTVTGDTAALDKVKQWWDHNYWFKICG